MDTTQVNGFNVKCRWWNYYRWKPGVSGTIKFWSFLSSLSSALSDALFPRRYPNHDEAIGKEFMVGFQFKGEFYKNVEAVTVASK